MRVEVPECKRCCFCLPLRHSLLVWGYLKLLANIVVLIILSFDWKYFYDDRTYMSSTTQLVYAFIATVSSITNIALSITFIVGCHQKNVILLTVFYTYSIITCVLQLILRGFNSIEIMISIMLFDPYEWKLPSMIFAFCFVELILQIYVIILVRSEIIKLNNSYQFQFTNNAAEAECTLKVNNVDSEEEAEHNNMHDVKETKSDEVMKVQVTSHH